MDSDSLILVRCLISRGGFSSEKVFRVKLADGTEHIGAAPARYYFTVAGQPMAPDQPPQRLDQVEGFLTGRIIAEEGDDILVSVPLGEVLRVKKTQATEFPVEGHAHVLVQP